MLTKSEIIAAVNLAYEAVNQSKVGPIYGEDECGAQVFNMLARETYLSVLNKTIPVSADFTAREVKEE